MVKSVEKTFAILEHLADHQAPISLGDISELLDGNKSTVRRFMITLKELGYVEQDPDSRLYSLAPKIAWLSRSIPRDITITSIAAPFLDRLARETEETINLGILDGHEVLYIDKRESTHRLRLCVEVGGRGPIHATALGKSILAYLPKQEREQTFSGELRLEKLTENTITSWAEFDLELERVRQEGLAYDNEELFEGLYCIGAPLFAGDAVVAALSISTPVSRMNDHRRRLFEKLVLEITKELSNELTISQPFLSTIKS